MTQNQKELGHERYGLIIIEHRRKSPKYKILTVHIRTHLVSLVKLITYLPRIGPTICPKDKTTAKSATAAPNGDDVTLCSTELVTEVGTLNREPTKITAYKRILPVLPISENKLIFQATSLLTKLPFLG